MAERSRIIDLESPKPRSKASRSENREWTIAMGALCCLSAAAGFYMLVVRMPECPADDEAFAVIQQAAVRQLPMPAAGQPRDAPRVTVTKTDNGECRYSVNHWVSAIVAGAHMEVGYDGLAVWSRKSETWIVARADMSWGD